MQTLARVRAGAQTIPGMLGALVALAVVVLVVVGGVVFGLQVEQQRARDRVVSLGAVLTRQQDTDMMHHALRAEVYVAFANAADPSGCARAQEAISAVHAPGGGRSSRDARCGSSVAASPTASTSARPAASPYAPKPTHGSGAHQSIDR